MGFAAFAGAGSVAVAGLSQRNLLARITAGNLGAFEGRVVGLHPQGGEVDGVPCLAQLDEPVDLAVLCLGATRLAAAVADLSARGVRRFVIPGAGANEGGRAVEGDLRATVRERDVEVLGPNCMGFASMHTGLVPYVGTLDPDLRPGSVGLVSQSGSVCELFTALPDRIGFSHVISVGNEMGVDLTEALRFLVEDPATSAVGLFIEGVRRPDDFRAALRAAAEAAKPVAALKVGASDTAREGTVAHTGVLAGDQGVFSAVLRDAGAIEVSDLGELLAVLELLGKGVSRPTGRIVVVGDSGGQANLVADQAASAGVELPALGEPTVRALSERFPSLGDAANPLDLWALGDPQETYRDGVAIVVERERHLVLLALDKFLARTAPEVAFVRAAIVGVSEPGAVALMAYAGGEHADPGILRACWERRIPVLRGARDSLAALAGLDRWHLRREQRDPPRDRTAPPPWEPGDGTEHDAKRLLAAAGIPVTREQEVTDAEEAVAAAARIGFPVVAKVAGPGVAHKTELGGVRLGLRSEEEVRTAAGELLALGPRVLVAEQAGGDLELIVGAFRDDQFGPCALLGLGGVWTESFGQAVVVAGPGTAGGVRRAVQSMPWGRLLIEGARGKRLDLDAVVDVALTLIDLVDGLDVEAIEINPLFLREDGVTAVDALVVPRKGAT